MYYLLLHVGKYQFGAATDHICSSCTVYTTVILKQYRVETISCIVHNIIYQHSNVSTTQSRTVEVCNKHNITVYRIPLNTTGWLQPCDIVLFGPAKQKVRKQHKLDRQSYMPPTLQRTCEQFSDALNSVFNSAIRHTWDALRTYTQTIETQIKQ